MLPIITTQKKDEILSWLCYNVRPGELLQIDTEALMAASDSNFGTIRAVIEDFRDIGLVDKIIQSEEGGVMLLVLKVKAHDLFQKGGFAVMDALTEANMQKILYELDHLKKQLQPDQMETFNKITSIAGALATVLSAFSTKE